MRISDWSSDVCSSDLLDIGQKQESDDITRGKTGHKFMENFFNGLKEGKSIEEAREGMLGDSKSIDPLSIHAAMLTQKYASAFKDTGFPLLVEEVVFHHLSNGITIALLPDLVWQYESGKVMVKDFKFTGRSWSLSRIQM